MTEIAASVPPTWKESNEQETTKEEFDTIRNNARRRQAELHETISFHKQYREAVITAVDRLREIEENLEGKESTENEAEDRPQIEVRGTVNLLHA